MNTGENEQGLRKIIDLTRIISISILILHFYYYCYGIFKQWQITSSITDGMLANVSHTGLFNNFYNSKLIALAFLLISLIGAKGRKDEKLNYKNAFAYIITGLALYIASVFIFLGPAVGQTQAIIYMCITIIGYILLLTGGTLLSRIIRQSLEHDIFNTLNETFPQEERLLENEYSINLPARYYLKNKLRKAGLI